MKIYLADTHTVLWYASGQRERLGVRARRLFTRLGSGTCEIALSVVSLWEIALLHDEGRIRLQQGFSAWCDAVEATDGFRIEPLLRADVEEARSLRGLVDPHDRLIAGTAVRLGAPLITRDRRISKDTRVRTLW